MIIMETDHMTILTQEYWWFLISVLGAALSLLFVQGGQSMLILPRSNDEAQSDGQLHRHEMRHLRSRW